MPHELLRFGNFELDPVRRVLSRDGEHIRLRPMAISLLCYLAQSRDRVVPKSELLEKLWPDGTGTDANLTVTVATIRKALGEAPGQNRLVVTVPREGYRFVGSLLEATASSRGVDLPRKVAVLPPEFLAPSGPGVLDRDLASAIGVEVANHAAQLAGMTILQPDVTGLGDGGYGELAISAGAEAVLTGTLSADDASVELDLKITDAQGQDRWHTRIVHPLAEAQSLPLRAARTVTGALNPEPGRPPRTAPPRGAEYSAAWRSYLQGRYNYVSGEGMPALHRAAVSFQQAVDLEDRLAPAHAGLAESLILLRSAAMADPEATARRVREAAQRAYRLEPLLAESHLAMAQVAMILDHDWSAGREHLMSALEFGPDNQWAHARYATFLAWRRQFEAALDSIRRAQSLDPFSIRLTAEVARIHHYAGQTGVALSILESATQRKADFGTGWILQSWFRIGDGDGNGALRSLEKLRPQLESTALWDIFSGTAHGIEGRAERAHESLESLRRRQANGEQVPAQFEGTILLSLGDFGGATDCIRRSGEERYTELAMVEADPFWAPVRSWPGYDPLRRRFFGKKLSDA